MSTPVTIIIPTLNEAGFIEGLLSDLASQTSTDFKVIVVDGNSSDETTEICSSFSDQLDLEILSCKRGVAAQRNFGVQHTSTKWSVFMDADNRIKTDFLEKLLPKLSSSIDTFSCLYSVDTYKKIEDKLIISLSNLAQQVNWWLDQPSVAGALIGGKTEIFKKITFDERKSLGEDHDLIQKILKNGYNFELFEQPRYHYSLRRMHNTNRFKFIGLYILFTINDKLGINNQVLSNFYPMNGGKQYTQAPESWLSPIFKLPKQFNTLTTTQLQKVTKSIKEINLWLENPKSKVR